MPQKGVHLIRHAIYRTMELGGQFILLGSSPLPHIQVVDYLCPDEQVPSICGCYILEINQTLNLLHYGLMGFSQWLIGSMDSIELE